MPRSRDSRVIRRRGRWYADFYDAWGVRRRFALDVPASATRRQADDAVAVWLAREHERLTRRPWRQAFDALIARLTPRKHPATIRKYEQAIAHFARHAEARRIRYLDELTPGFIAEVIADLARDHAPMGVNSLRSSLRAILNQLDKWDLMPAGYSSRQWFDGTRMPDERRERLYSDLELRALFADPTYGDVFLLLYLTGARVGELVSLHTSHVGERAVDYPWSKRSRTGRRAPLSAEARELMLRPPADVGILPGYVVWRERWGSPDDERRRTCAIVALHKRLNQVLSTAGYPPGRVHDIRATTATHLAPRVSMLVLQQIMGWTTPAVAARYYRQRPEDVTIPALPVSNPRRNAAKSAN
jgi:integrase